jgi:hypothetical protein
MDMKNSFRVLFSVLFISASLLTAAEIKSKSKIVSVTVFNDQALVTRECKENVPAGTQKVVISDLPWMLMDQSLKVTGTSDNGTKISDIKIDQLFLDTIPEGRLSEVLQKISQLKSEKNTLERSNIVTKSQLDAVDALKDNYTKSLALQNPGQKVSVEEWEKLLQFVEKKKTEYTERMESVRREIDSKVNKVKLLEEQLASIGGATKKEQKQVSVVLNSEKAGNVRLEISYLITGASWNPSYEIRAQSNDRSIQITYSGNVQQSTGESWENVNMVLSTARPAASEDLPELWKWNIDDHPVYSSNPYFNKGRTDRQIPTKKSIITPTSQGNTLTGRVVDNQTGEVIIGASVVIEGTNIGGSANENGEYVIYNVPAGTYSVRISCVGYNHATMSGVRISSTAGARQTFYLSPSSASMNEVVIMSERPVVEKYATNSVRMSSAEMISVDPEESVSSSQITSSSFTIRSLQSIPSDNQPHKVGISVDEIPVSFFYQVVPKLVRSAFLVGKGMNIRDYPLLAGNANIFLDNSFVATISLKTVMPKDTFSINLGIDEAIRVEWKQVKRFAEQTGTFTSKNKLSLEFESSVQNFKKYPVEIILFDHIPVPANEKITVTVTEPDPKLLAPNSDGIYRRTFTLPPAEKRMHGLKFSIEYPQDMAPYGLPR